MTDRSPAFGAGDRVRELRTAREAAAGEGPRPWNKASVHKGHPPLVGAEKGLRAVTERVALVARSDVPVLILGETGSGKEVVSRSIHDHSDRRSGPFLRVNCGAIAPELIDSELFGHERGSFTGAVSTRKGWFERADQGSLLLDEIGELSLAAQVRLLRVLQDASFERVGGERPLRVDVRVIAATHRDLPSMIADGRFREDLWYRIAVFPIVVPPLRERLEDIPALAEYFTEQASGRFGIPPLAPSPEDLRLLALHPWPGNVCELATVIDRAVILGGGRQLEVAKALSLVPTVVERPRPAQTPFAEEQPPDRFPTLDEAVGSYIESAVVAARGRIEGPRGAACALGVNPHTLRARMRRLKIDWRRFRPPTSTAPSFVDSAPSVRYSG